MYPFSKHQNIISLLIITTIWFLFSWPWLVNDNVIPHDAKNHFYPMIRFVATSWHSGESFLWSPHHFGGFPMVADPQSAIWTASLWIPILLSAEPSMQLVDFIHLCHLLVGAFAIFAFGRNCGWRHEVSIIASITYMLAGAPTFRLEHLLMTVSYMWLAIAMWRLDILIKKGGLWRGVLFGLSLAFLLIDRNHVAYLGAWLLFIYWLASLGKDIKLGWKILPLIKQNLPIALGAIVALMIIAVPIILLLQLAQNSNRPEFGLIQAGWQSLHPASLITLFLPEYFGALDGSVRHWGPASSLWGGENLVMHRGMLHLYSGVLPIILILWVGIVKRQLFTSNIRFFALTSIFYLIYSLGRYTPIFAVLYEWVPGIDLFRRPSDGLFIFGFTIAILTGALLNKALEITSSTKPIWMPIIFVILLLSTCFIIANQNDRLQDFAFSLVLPIILSISIIILFFALNQKAELRSIVLSMMVILTGFDLIYHSTNNRMNTRPKESYVVLEKPHEHPVASHIMKLLPNHENPNEIWRTEIIGLGPVVQNLPQVIGSHSMLGYNPLRIKAIEKYIAPDMQNNASKKRNFGMKMTGYDSEMTNKLGLRYIISGALLENMDDNISKGRFKLLEKIIYGKRTAYIYENENTSSRATLLSNANKEIASSIKITHYSNAKVKLLIDAEEQGKLVLNDFYYPGWFATVNGKETAISKHNDIFRSAPIPQGKSEVIFEFDPLRFSNLWHALKNLGRAKDTK